MASFFAADALPPDLAGRAGDAIANSLTLSGAKYLVREVMIGGGWATNERRLEQEEPACAAYVRAVTELLN